MRQRAHRASDGSQLKIIILIKSHVVIAKLGAVIIVVEDQIDIETFSRQSTRGAYRISGSRTEDERDRVSLGGLF